MNGLILGTGSFDDGSGKDFEADGRIIGTVILDDGRGEPLVGREHDGEEYEVDGR